MSERRDVVIQVPIIKANTRAPAEFIQHHCPLCEQDFDWTAFQDHAPMCIEDHPERVKALVLVATADGGFGIEIEAHPERVRARRKG